ncbi:regulator of G-protein signaling 1 [Nothobranchius furzeri]|uniref:Regulator of G-protein signaling 1-like n=2 Tax=Nothobranchius TaxID=28779 RepID=A0A1A7ZNW7_NOTFU|nr:regulator of G-protein signaling 1 [Nothobranchius furzeri]KAF7221626.1 regulator of G-protein signaling 1-like [Nothobranchius furzeri]
MRRFSSESSLLDLDCTPWKKAQLQNPDHGNSLKSGSYTQVDKGVSGVIPIIQEPQAASSRTRRNQFIRKISISAENLNDLGKLDNNHLAVSTINENCRAYSDSKLGPDAQNGTESLERGQKPSSSSSAYRNLHKAKLSAAKLHLKSLFGQSPPSSNPNLSNPESKESPTEKRSRLLFLHQWSPAGHNKKGKISRDELEKWTVSLNALLASPTGVTVFGAFLRSEFSEENLQFYLACEEYKHSSNNFSLHRRAKDISTMYIQPGAPREVNLDSKTRDQTLQLLQAPNHTSLLPAQKRIFSLLDTDCYPRFLQSNIYQTLLQEAE